MDIHISNTGWLCEYCGLVHHTDVRVRQVATSEGQIIQTLTHDDERRGLDDTYAACGGRIEWGTLAEVTEYAKD